MKIQAINTSSQSNQTNFKANFVGEAKDFANKAYKLIKQSGDKKDIQDAENYLICLHNMGKHFNGINKPLKIVCHNPKNNIYEFGTLQKGKFIRFLKTKDFNRPLAAKSFLNNLLQGYKNSLIGQNARKKDMDVALSDVLEHIGIKKNTPDFFDIFA